MLDDDDDLSAFFPHLGGRNAGRPTFDLNLKSKDIL